MVGLNLSTDIAEATAEKVYRQKELQFAEKIYEKQLGLKFLRNAEGHLRLVFTQIDLQNPARECFFSVSVDIDNQYHGSLFSSFLSVSDSPRFLVTECEPRVTGFESLLADVNRTNDFGPFVARFRRLFVEYFQRR